MNSQQHPPVRARHRADCKCDCDRQALAAAALLERPELRAATADRDILTMYRLLQRYGFSQRRIAALTGQSQSEISDILKGGRKIRNYDLLLRIADGLGLPRGWMGLAHDTAAHPTGEGDVAWPR